MLSGCTNGSGRVSMVINQLRNGKKFFYQHLKHGKLRRKRVARKDERGIIHNLVLINKRPKIVHKRIRTGDIEVDFMMGMNPKGAMLVMTDRTT